MGDSPCGSNLIQHAGWRRRPAWMARPYSMDLRERVVGAVEEGGLSRNEAAARFGIGISTAINWVRRFKDTGSVAPGQMGGHKPKAIRGEHEIWLRERVHAGDFTLRGLVGELAERGLKVDYRTVWNFVHGEKLSFKKPCTPASRIVLTSRAGDPSGKPVRVQLSRHAWSSSTRPGPRRTWCRCEDGAGAACGSGRRLHTDAGRP